MPTFLPTATPTLMPTPMPTFIPTAIPTMLTFLTSVPMPSYAPTALPSYAPTEYPTESPTVTMGSTGMSHDKMRMPGSDMQMSMVMTFGKWEDYKLKLVFDSWDIQTKTQYFFTWVFVVLAVIAWHGLKHLQTTLVEENMKSVMLNSKIMSHDEGDFVSNNPQIEATKSGSGSNFLLPDGKLTLSSRKFWILRLTHSLLSTLMYALALLLMLVSMSYNCGLFLALLVGYFAGDLIFYKSILGSNHGLQHTCH
jgi:Ctr copper transporter family